MRKENPEKLQSLKHHSKKAFEKMNPEFMKNVQGDAEKIRQVREVQERAEMIRKQLATHCKKHRSEWVAKETLKVFDEHQKPTLKYPKPNWALDQPANISYTEIARKRVQLRIQGRIKQIGEIERNMQLRITRNAEVAQSLQSGSEENIHKNSFYLKSDVHLIVARTQMVRAKANAHFANHRDQWIENARKQGAISPERDVFQKQNQRLFRINQAEHRLIHQTFKDHGQSMPQEQTPTIKRDFDQTMG